MYSAVTIIAPVVGEAEEPLFCKVPVIVAPPVVASSKPKSTIYKPPSERSASVVAIRVFVPSETTSSSHPTNAVVTFAEIRLT